MHRDLIRQIDEAVAEVFAIMLNLACTSEAVDSPPDGKPPAFACLAPNVTASVQFSGEFEGRCCLQMAERTATELTSNMMGLPQAEISHDLCADTAGELCNMIAGCWKKRHPIDLAAAALSCPTLTKGCCSHEDGSFREDVTLRYHFDSHHLTLRVAFN